jgi:hypothetical protein
MRWLVALFLLTNIAFAQSQQQVQKQNTPAANSSQQTETDKRGTAQEPIIVKILPTQKSQAEADKEEHEKPRGRKRRPKNLNSTPRSPSRRNGSPIIRTGSLGLRWD